MRPIQLTMSAFGPYRGEVVLDFTSFGASSIFLVTGPTGAGKTTIFDALTYALFNDASGTSREVDMLKSQFATDEDLCFVELIFEVGQEEYRVKRIPKQKGPGTRSKVRNYTSDVTFYKGEQLLGNGREANEAIIELLGLSFEQFRQIVMLPQGEFRRLLQSNSGEKEAIFRNIFGTETIQNFQETLKEKRKELRDHFKTYQTRLEQSLSTMPMTTDEKLAEAIQKADYEEVLAILEVFIAEGEEELARKRQEIKQLSRNEKENEAYIQLLEEKKQLEEAKKELDAAAREVTALQEALRRHEEATEVNKEEQAYEKFLKEFKQTETDLNEKKKADQAIKVEIADLERKDKAARKDEEQLDGLRKEVTELETEQKQFDTLEKKADALKEENSQLKAIRTTMKKLEQAGEQYTEDVQDLSSALQKIDGWRKDLKEEQKCHEDLNRAQEKIETEKEVLEKVLRLRKELATLLKEDEAASKEYKKAQEAYEQARQHYFGNLAGVLVSELEEEAPCPVCGSTHHPQPAETTADALTEEALSDYETARDEAKAKHTELATAMKHKGTQIEEQKALLENESDDYEARLASMKREAAIVGEKITASTKTISDIEEKLSQEKEWRQALEEAQAENQDTQLKLTQAESRAESMEEKIDELKAEIKAVDDELTYSSPKEIQAAITERQNKIKSIQEEVEKTRNALSTQRNKQTQIETSLGLLTEQLQKNNQAAEEQKDILEALLLKYDFNEEFSDYLLDEDIEKEYTQAIEQYKEEKSYNTRQLKQVAERLEKQADTRTIAAVQEALGKIKEEKERLEKERDILIAQNSQQTNSYHEIKGNYQESQKIYKPLAIYEELAEIANGSKETSYVSFERYVLGIYFNEVLYAANQRFEIMTNGRYEMVRRKDQTKGTGADGLEIDVFDRYAGATRSVRTLSGGETFKASLALALGLSDVIQSEQGGVQVETLFIDEGFGTLDADSLEMAIETLMELQTTGRLIGVISHVNELKDRIPARIVVENKQEGSHARIEVE